MTINSVLKKITSVNYSSIKSFELDKTTDGCDMLRITVSPHKSKQCRCPLCDNGKKLPRYDSRNHLVRWRGLDCGGLIVEIESYIPRVECPVHGVITSAVPWAFHNSRFTKDFDITVAWMAKCLSKSAISQYMRISWATVGRCISRVREYVEPDIFKRFAFLRRIGVDETSYSKGHRYITTVVDHDTNTVVWVAEGHDYETLSKFFLLLSKEQREAIEVISGDGAKWITKCAIEFCPNAKRCTDPFHVVGWATEALDGIRKEAWRDANQALKEQKKEVKRGRGRPAKDDEKSKQLSEAKDSVKDIKNSRYVLGKAPENLTDNQQVKLAQIKAKDKRLYRAYQLKEALRNLLKIKDIEVAKRELKQWIFWASHSQINQFKELAKKIINHREFILNFIKTGISNARVEANNNKISLLIHRSFGFRNLKNMYDLILLICSDIKIPLPNRPLCSQIKYV